jgi:hypothetical protein
VLVRGWWAYLRHGRLHHLLGDRDRKRLCRVQRPPFCALSLHHLANESSEIVFSSHQHTFTLHPHDTSVSVCGWVGVGDSFKHRVAPSADPELFSSLCFAARV